MFLSTCFAGGYVFVTPDMVNIIFSPAIVYRFAGAKMVKRRDTPDWSKGFIVGPILMYRAEKQLMVTMNRLSNRLVEGNFIQVLIYELV